ncbi:hypothetical protein [Streptomyces sp. A0592]|uniref:hypothetical protein n=1 Tax=Streptomyces sp. A0592 TaxID=2563099 RepID=UPI00109E51EA|nr:hypothetical protein [Streptomyces sp. A0592]THA82410.1 hypothetical protein E6U81_20110 [Streptomyces sp. A0592]
MDPDLRGGTGPVRGTGERRGVRVNAMAPASPGPLAGRPHSPAPPTSPYVTEHTLVGDGGAARQFPYPTIGGEG